jgi:glycosyltransferase involved in cell wall biosynthesis
MQEDIADRDWSILKDGAHALPLASVQNPKTRILWVTLHFPPRQSGGVFRPIKIYKYLDKNKFEVDFLTLSLWGQYKRAVRDDSVLEEVIPKPTIYRMPSIELHLIVDSIRRRNQGKKLRNGMSSRPVGGSGNSKSGAVKALLKGAYRFFLMFLYFPDQHVIWGWLSTLKSLWLHFKRGYDLIYTTSNPPSGHLPGVILKLLGVRWVADYRDGGSLWNKKAWGNSIGKFRETIDFYYQRYVLNKADYVIVHSELLKEQFIKVFSLDRSSIRAIPNGYDEVDFVRPSTQGPPFIKKQREIHMLHVGAWVLSAKETVKVIEELNSLRLGLRERGLDLVLHAVGNDLFNEEQKNNALHIQYLYHGVIPHPLLPPYLFAADCYFLSTSAGKLVEGARGFLPGKLWEYLRGGKPIVLFGPKDEAWQIIEDSRVGIHLGEMNSEDHVSADALLHLLEETRNLNSKVSQHSWESRARAMQDVFQQVLE